jgi:spectinomycin phosphotransferase
VFLRHKVSPTLESSMRERPTFVSDAEVLGVVSEGWRADVDAVEHLPVGFGAYHWVARQGGTPRLFVTLDALEPRRTTDSLEAAYAGAAALASSGLEFIVAPVAHRSGSFTAALAGHALSCTPWREGVAAGTGPVEDERLARDNAAALARLHAAKLELPIPAWRPLVGPELADTLAALVRPSWSTGPYGKPARVAIQRRLPAIGAWTAAYHRLADRARSRPWVPTHGEPHTRNQLLTSDGVVFVDWESLARAPRERDLRPLVDSGHAELVAPDQLMLEMFDLEWRLDEVSQYAAWFASPHVGSEDDRVAFGGLLAELDRPYRH